MYLSQPSYVINHADARDAMQGSGDIQEIVGWQNDREGKCCKSWGYSSQDRKFK